MKSKSLLLLALCLFFAGCDKIKDATAITIPTHLQLSIPVSATTVSMKSAEVTGAVTAASFSTTQDLNLASNADISAYLSKINEINMNSVVVTISGLSAGQTINTISLSAAGIGVIFTQTNITMANSSFTPNVTTAILSQLGSKLKADKKLSFTVSGTTSGPMTFTVGLDVDTKFVVNTI